MPRLYEDPIKKREERRLEAIASAEHEANRRASAPKQALQSAAHIIRHWVDNKKVLQQLAHLESELTRHSEREKRNAIKKAEQEFKRKYK